VAREVEEREKRHRLDAMIQIVVVEVSQYGQAALLNEQPKDAQ